MGCDGEADSNQLRSALGGELFKSIQENDAERARGLLRFATG
jgi:hypothetical protein